MKDESEPEKLFREVHSFWVNRTEEPMEENEYFSVATQIEFKEIQFENQPETKQNISRIWITIEFQNLIQFSSLETVDLDFEIDEKGLIEEEQNAYFYQELKQEIERFFQISSSLVYRKSMRKIIEETNTAIQSKHKSLSVSEYTEEKEEEIEETSLNSYKVLVRSKKGNKKILEIAIKENESLELGVGLITKQL